MFDTGCSYRQQGSSIFIAFCNILSIETVFSLLSVVLETLVTTTSFNIPTIRVKNLV
jgi:hypothetical protein